MIALKDHGKRIHPSIHLPYLSRDFTIRWETVAEEENDERWRFTRGDRRVIRSPSLISVFSTRHLTKGKGGKRVKMYHVSRFRDFVSLLAGELLNT